VQYLNSFYHRARYSRCFIALVQVECIVLINLPIAAVVVFYGWRLLPSKKSMVKPHFDWTGMALIALLLASFAYGINNIEVSEGLKGVLSVNVLPFLLITLITLPLFVFLEKRSPSPVVKIELFDVKQIRIVGLVAFGTGIIQAVTIFVPEMAVNVLEFLLHKPVLC